MKLHLSGPSVLHHVLSNLSKEFSLIIVTKSRRRKTCSTNSKLSFVKVGAAIEDGFQRRPMQFSVLTLLDFSKPYNRIWGEIFLLNMLNVGIPFTFVRWLCSILNDRRAHVQLFNVFSFGRRFTQGLPQSSVLAPFTVFVLH